MLAVHTKRESSVTGEAEHPMGGSLEMALRSLISRSCAAVVAIIYLRSLSGSTCRRQLAEQTVGERRDFKFELRLECRGVTQPGRLSPTPGSREEELLFSVVNKRNAGEGEVEINPAQIADRKALESF